MIFWSLFKLVLICQFHFKLIIFQLWFKLVFYSAEFKLKLWSIVLVKDHLIKKPACKDLFTSRNLTFFNFFDFLNKPIPHIFWDSPCFKLIIQIILHSNKQIVFRIIPDVLIEMVKVCKPQFLIYLNLILVLVVVNQIYRYADNHTHETKISWRSVVCYCIPDCVTMVLYSIFTPWEVQYSHRFTDWCTSKDQSMHRSKVRWCTRISWKICSFDLNN
jgi:hypothetical protein